MRSLLLFIDTETGGLDPQVHSLLSLGLYISSPDFSWPFYWEFKLDEYVCTEEALSINGLDPNKLRVTGKTEAEIAKEFLEVLEIIQKKQPGRITLAGHNIQFDLGFLKAFLKRNGIDFGKYFHYRSVDTSSILTFLADQGKVKERCISLERAAQIFQLTDVQTHNAVDDAILTSFLYDKLLAL